MRRSWALLAALGVLIAALVFIEGPQKPDGSPDHRSTSDAADGTSALWFYSRALGHASERVEGSFDLPAGGLLFVFSPDIGSSYTSEETSRVLKWVDDGGVLVYAAEAGDSQLNTALNLARTSRPTVSTGTPAAPILAGVTHVTGGEFMRPFHLEADQAAWIRSPDNNAMVLSIRHGKGRVIALADPVVLVNDHIQRDDNGRLAADLIDLAEPGSKVLFDEYHHGAVDQPAASPIDFLLTRWGAALGLAILVFVVGVLLRSRSFGPRLVLTPAAGRSSAEYASAVGALLRRSRARAVTLEVLDGAARRALAERVGLGGQPAAEAFTRVLQQRAPALAQELANAESGLQAGAQSEQSLLLAARLLHRLSYPLQQSQEATRQ
jgi:hypothetical protein